MQTFTLSPTYSSVALEPAFGYVLGAVRQPRDAACCQDRCTSTPRREARS